VFLKGRGEDGRVRTCTSSGNKDMERGSVIGVWSCDILDLANLRVCAAGPISTPLAGVWAGRPAPLYRSFECHNPYYLGLKDKTKLDRALGMFA